MSQKVHLVDLRELKWPTPKNYGYVEFYSLQVFECWVCHSITNTAYGWSSSVQIICPAQEFCWHHELRAKILWLHQYPHPRIYQEMLEQEIAEVRAENRPQTTVVGTPDLSQKLSVTCTIWRTSDKPRCKHYYLPDMQGNELERRPYHPGTDFRWGDYKREELMKIFGINEVSLEQRFADMKTKLEANGYQVQAVMVDGRPAAAVIYENGKKVDHIFLSHQSFADLWGR